MLHKGHYTRKEEVNAFEFGKLWEAWSLFREKMKPIRKWQADEEEKTKMQCDILVGMNSLVESQNANIATIIESMKVKEIKKAKLIKLAKVLAWTKEMTLAVYLKELEAWMKQNKDISEHVRFQDVIESLKMNKEVNGLAKYVGEHILPVLDTVETQTMMQIVGYYADNGTEFKNVKMDELVSKLGISIWTMDQRIVHGQMELMKETMLHVI